MYQFIHELNGVLEAGTEVVSDAGSAYYVTSQALQSAVADAHIRCSSGHGVYAACSYWSVLR